jgi:FAD/FMN-containing dehydrogenase
MIGHDLLQRFQAIVGAANTLGPDDDLSRYVRENRNIYVGATPLVLKPAGTQEVARIVSLASETRTPLVPQGGHTGHVGGAAPDESGTQIVVSLERMRAIREIDTAGNTVTVEAGAILQAVQERALANERLFPLSLASQGSCQIGGNIATNAGGTGVLAYGNMRDLVLGLEVVLPSGEVWDGLRKLKKDNTGYAVKELFVGSEGTLGIITAAVLKLLPLPKGSTVAWAGLATPEQALSLYELTRSLAGGALTAFEIIHRTPLEFALRHVSDNRDPFAVRYQWYVLAEISSGRSHEDARALTESIFAAALGKELIADAVMSETVAQRSRLWKLREDIPPAQEHEGASIKHDVSVPVHLIPEFVKQAWAIVGEIAPGARPCVFGHMGDGNLHFNVSQPAGGDAAQFLDRRPLLNARIHRLVGAMSGSIAAEHGIGRLKRELLAENKSAVEMDIMRAIKQALDPNGIMNPGKVL